MLTKKCGLRSLITWRKHQSVITLWTDVFGNSKYNGSADKPNDVLLLSRYSKTKREREIKIFFFQIFVKMALETVCNGRLLMIVYIETSTIEH
jgi:hypothetical protein